MNTAFPKAAGGFNMSIAQLWGSGPKWTITCGDCEATFSKRIPVIDRPGIICPHCGTVNILRIRADCGEDA